MKAALTILISFLFLMAGHASAGQEVGSLETSTRQTSDQHPNKQARSAAKAAPAKPPGLSLQPARPRLPAPNDPAKTETSEKILILILAGLILISIAVTLVCKRANRTKQKHPPLT